MKRKQMSGMLPVAGYEAFPLSVQLQQYLCDGLSQLFSVDVVFEAHS